MKNILSVIEQAAQRFPARIAVSDGETDLSYAALLEESKRIGSYLGRLDIRHLPVAVYMDKVPACVSAFLGVVYGGGFYVVLDSAMPPERIARIFETLQPRALLTDEKHWQKVQAIPFDGLRIRREDALEEPVNLPLLTQIRAEMTESDPLYILYTSGSTGRPKGAVISHRAVLAYTRWAIDTFGFDETTVFGSQTPFYFSMSVTDLYSALETGGRLQIIPRELFSFPLPLIEYLDKYQVNTLYWVPSALCLLANWDAFSYQTPSHLRQVLFAGEVMPCKQLNYWRRFLPQVRYANLFGPTETTDICTCYPVDRAFADGDSLPIGRPCDNCRAFVVNEAGQAAREGELYIGGPFLSNGYYRDPEKTAAAFVQNPLNDTYPEIVYRTGDLVSYNDQGELLYQGRKDNQIKRMGYRIELGEIEANAGALDGISSCACVYFAETEELVLFYEGSEKADLPGWLSRRVPAYMLPNVFLQVRQMPHNANGKIDRNALKQQKQKLQEAYHENHR